jgi:hypothetical protein
MVRMRSILAGLLMSGVSAAEEWKRPPGWTETKGGDDGKVIEVTTLEPRGAGSLAEALAAEGPRKVVFKVGGIINLAGRTLKISRPNVTIAGETAPSPGITLIRGGLAISTDDVIVRHLRVRCGENGREKKSGWEVDGIATNAAKDVIVDHCSIAWATDENLSASGPRFAGANPEEWRNNTSHRITFSHCIVGEGLKDSTHAKGVHSMGSLIHDNTSDVLVYGNLYISNNDRNPLFKGGARGAVVNNLINNPGMYALTYNQVEKEWGDHPYVPGRISLAGNVLRMGESSRRFGFARIRGNCELWFSDNLMLGKDGKELPPRIDFVDQKGKPLDAKPDAVVMKEEAPTWPGDLKAKSSTETAAWVLENAGARPWDRDAVDKRLIEEARTGGGKIINSENEVGGYDSLLKE